MVRATALEWHISKGWKPMHRGQRFRRCNMVVFTQWGMSAVGPVAEGTRIIRVGGG